MNENLTDPSVSDQQMMDILLVLNKEEKTIKAVKGMDKEGNLQTVSPNEANQSEFMKFDGHKSIAENFLSNLWRQLKNPTNFIFMKVNQKEAEQAATVFQENVKNPTQAGDELMNRYKVEPKQLAQTQEEKPQPKQDLSAESQPQPEVKQPEQKTETTPEQNPNYRYNPAEIDWESLKNIGISKEQLEKNGTLETMLKGYKSPGTIPIAANLGTAIFKFDARLSFQKNPDGRIVFAMHGIRKEPDLNQKFFGHQFSEEDKKNLRETGNMGRVVEVTNFKTGELIPSLISVDRQTNELVSMRTEQLRIPEEIKGVKLDDQQKQQLREGKAIHLDGMISKNGKPFSASIQMNADKRNIEYLFDREKQQSQKQLHKRDDQQQPEGGNHAYFARQIKGVPVTKEQLDTLNNGKAIHLINMVHQGHEFTAYVKLNDRNIPKFYEQNPDIAVQNGKTNNVTPTNAHRIQMAVNKDGKTDEATKHVQKPLKSGQTEPTEKQKEKQEQQQVPKSRGHRL